MHKTEYILLDRTDHPSWDQVAIMFTRMYDRMEEMGLQLPLAEDGTEKWIKTTQNTSGKFGILVVAREGDKAVGFAHGMIKFLPDYLGGYPIGTITHIFVEEEARKSGIGRELVNELEEWFSTRNVHSVELQVISGNSAGKGFWKKLGYEEELLQYRKTSRH